MSSVPFRRRRLAAPEVSGGEVHLEPPPELPSAADPISLVTADLLLVLSVLAAVAGSALLLVGRGQVPLTLVGVALIAGAVGGAVRSSRDRRGSVDQDRVDFERYLDQMRERAREAATAQRAERTWVHPPPDALWSLVGTPRMWERVRADSSFGHVRVGTGPQRLATRLVPPQTGPVEELEPLSTLALRRFVRRYSLVPDLPISVATRGFAGIRFSGDEESVRGVVRAMLCALAFFHGPDVLRIAVAAGPGELAEWDWVKWLPHVLDPTRADGAGPARLIVGSIRELERLLGDDLARRPAFKRGAPPLEDRRHLVGVLDGVTPEHDFLLTPEGLGDVAVLDVSGVGLPRSRSLALAVAPDALEALSSTGAERFGRPDHLSRAQAGALARQLAPYRLSTGQAALGGPTRADSFPGLLGLDDVDALDVDRLWALRGERELLRVPIGYDDRGRPVELDLKAGTGVGPHGLVVGRAGAGKTELLRALVLALAVTHPPDEVNLLLVGGPEFLDLTALPHTTSVVPVHGTDATQVALLERLGHALTGELHRRRNVLGEHGNRRDHERARALGADLEPVPALLIVLDRFDALPDVPELHAVLLELARTGTSLGVHLLVAVRQVGGNSPRGLDRFASYRIAMRADSPEESRATIGTDDAHELYPGEGLLVHRSGTGRFVVPPVSGPVGGAGGSPRPVLPFTGEHVPVTAIEAPDHRTSLLAAVVGRLVGRAPRARPVWTPPLDAAAGLTELLGPLREDPARGLCPETGGGGLLVPIGQVDDVREHRHDTLVVDLSGHVVVVGRRRSGKSSVLRALVMSLALTHTPREAQVYCLDLGEDGALGDVAGLPHVGVVAGAPDTQRVRRTAELVSTLLAEREELFFRVGVDSMADYRARRAAGEFGEAPYGDVLVVVDDWGRLRREHPGVADGLAASAARAADHGIHLVVTATAWEDAPHRSGSALWSVLELRLADPATSEVGPRYAARVPENRPGHGVEGSGLRFVTALPRADGHTTSEDLPAGLAALVSRIRGAWPGPHAPAPPVLPDRLDAADLPAVPPGGAIPIGIGGRSARPVFVDFTAAAHFLVFGDRGSGKSTLLGLVAEALAGRHRPGEARVLRWDRRSPPSAEEIASVVEDLSGREDGGWSGPGYFLLVDDYEAMTPPGGVSPLRPLARLLPRGAQIGLHVVIARRARGAAQARYETVLAALHRMGTPGVVLSGDPDEGAVLADQAPVRRSPGRGVLVDHDGTTSEVRLARTAQRRG
ncbi:type VII secretion protein EccCa [Saccharothrix lopnurensis]|uniref:Type VII secretion protein EccCa n=1 Tax=Saccharothrix lopnurensis TaxID=1670621 RepID=A0ABW1PAD1_9PSEU